MNTPPKNKGSVRSMAKVPRNKVPDYFVGIRVSSPLLADIRHQVISRTPQAENMMLDPCESHVTLGIVKVDEAEPDISLQKVIQGFTQGASQARRAVGRFSMHFDSFDTFRGSVLFLKPTQDCADTLLAVRDCIFHEEGISTYWIDNDRLYAPHMTIAKHSRLRKRKIEKMKFDPSVYPDMSKTPVHSEATSIQLCRIAGRKMGEYYTIVAEELL
jgi:2'-5' RNA ligase